MLHLSIITTSHLVFFNLFFSWLIFPSIIVFSNDSCSYIICAKYLSFRIISSSHEKSWFYFIQHEMICSSCGPRYLQQFSLALQFEKNPFSSFSFSDSPDITARCYNKERKLCLWQYVLLLSVWSLCILIFWLDLTQFFSQVTQVSLWLMQHFCVLLWRWSLLPLQLLQHLFHGLT